VNQWMKEQMNECHVVIEEATADSTHALQTVVLAHHYLPQPVSGIAQLRF